MRSTVTRALTLSVCALLAIPAVSQGKNSRSGDDDMRDAVILKNGKEKRGRVLQRHDAKEVLLMQGGKRVRIKAKRVQRMETVRDKLRRYFEQRAGQDHDKAATHWALCEWAAKQDLDHIAQIEAYATLVRDPDHEAAHEFLSHRKRKSGWRWPLKSRWVKKAEFDKYTSDIGHPLELRSEHFIVESDAGLPRVTDALFDLERMYLWWLDEFGAKLELQEVVRPLRIRIFDSGTSFPGWSSAPMPYFVPNPYDDRSYVFFESDKKRPTRMFEVATQHLLYRTLVRDADPGGLQQRFCAWLEIGIAQWVESRFSGLAGEIQVGEPSTSGQDAALALHGDRYSLKNMLHLTLRDHFYATGSLRGSARFRSSTRAETHWAAVHTFVAFLMDTEANPEMAGRVMKYMRVALGEGKGDSSKVFDKQMGRAVEKFEKPWQDWLERKATAPSRAPR